jgi:hypothetical protein
LPACNTSALGASCQATCPTHLATSCSDTSTITVCHVNADCTDTTYNQCCTFKSGSGANSGTITFCVDSGTAFFGTCHP